MGAKRTLIAGLALQAVAISLYLLTGGLASFYALALVFGFAYGGVMPLYAIVVREYFGERIMGAAFGAVSLAATLGMALGPWLGGWRVRRARQLRLDVHRLLRDRPRSGGHRAHVPAAPLASGDIADSERGPLRERSRSSLTISRSTGLKVTFGIKAWHGCL